MTRLPRALIGTCLRVFPPVLHCCCWVLSDAHSRTAVFSLLCFCPSVWLAGFSLVLEPRFSALFPLPTTIFSLPTQFSCFSPCVSCCPWSSAFTSLDKDELFHNKNPYSFILFPLLCCSCLPSAVCSGDTQLFGAGRLGCC